MITVYIYLVIFLGCPKPPTYHTYILGGYKHGSKHCCRVLYMTADHPIF